MGMMLRRYHDKAEAEAEAKTETVKVEQKEPVKPAPKRTKPAAK